MRGPSVVAPLQRILHIQAGEGARVGIMFVYSAAPMGGVLTVGLVVAESLFMSQLPPSGTPFVFIIPAVSEVLILLAYSRLAARFRLDRLVIGSMVALLIIGVLFRLLLATSAGTSFGTLVAAPACA